MPQRRVTGVALALAAVLVLSGCAPGALGLANDDHIRQGIAPASGQGWGSVDLQNVTGGSIELDDVHLTGLHNMRVGRTAVIRVTKGNGIGFFPPPLTAGMRREFAAAVPVRGFVLPAHSHDAYELVFLLGAVDRHRDATSRTVVVEYTSGGLHWSEVRHSAFCIAVRAFHGCES